MLGRTLVRGLNRGLTAALLLGLGLSLVPQARAGNFRNGAVGGIVIRIDGVVRNAETDALKTLAKMRREELASVSAPLNRPVETRKISLKALEAACQKYLVDQNGKLPDEITYLGGLQRIEYVLVYPDAHDIVLVGPAEGWMVNDQGAVVGITTGRPVLQLDDLIVALRTISTARQGGISCSIDPTPQGYQALNTLLKNRRGPLEPSDIPQLERSMKQAFGAQQVSVNGIPVTSHYARVLVAADYRMKRLAMKLDDSPVRGLPSFVEMGRRGRSLANNVNPRWWLAANYEPVLRSEDGLSWQLRGQGVKCMTEDELVGDDGNVQQTGKTDPVAQKWADKFTEKFDELAAVEPVFGELRNVIDMSIVAAIIDQNDLCGQAGCSLPLLTGEQKGLSPDTWFAPKTVSPECSFLKSGKRWIVTASGGVQINPFSVATRTETSQSVAAIRQQVRPTAADNWWWN